jgi:hypothetical protein
LKEVEEQFSNNNSMIIVKNAKLKEAEAMSTGGTLDKVRL